MAVNLRGVKIFKSPNPPPATPWALLRMADDTISVVMHAAWLSDRMQQRMLAALEAAATR